MQQNSTKEDALKDSLTTILNQENISLNRALIERLSAELQISILDCASALSFLALTQTKPTENKTEKRRPSNPNVDFPIPVKSNKFIRYRIDVGQMHKVQVEEIKTVLVDVTGVDYKLIGRMEIRNHYTLIDLPEGMPADIFQLLSETEIRQQRLNLKRIKFQRRFQRRNKRTV